MEGGWCQALCLSRFVAIPLHRSYFKSSSSSCWRTESTRNQVQVITLRNASNVRLGRLAAMCRRKELLKIATKEPESVVIPESTFSQDMKSAINDYHYSDIKFLFPGDLQSITRPVLEGSDEDNAIPTVQAHKALLHARSTYFARLFQSDFKEREQTEFTMDSSLSQETFVSVLDYLYTGNELVSPDNALDLLEASDHLMLDDLKQIVEAYAESSIELENTAWLVELSDRFGAYRLKRACMEVMFDSNHENWEKIRSSEGFADLRVSSPHLLREIDFQASKRNLIHCGELLRGTDLVTLQQKTC